MIIIRIILNFSTACKEWGLFAGIIIKSPDVKRFGLPEIRISASPSMIFTRASKGAVCSLKPWPLSKAKIVTEPTSFLIISLLTTSSVSQMGRGLGQLGVSQKFTFLLVSTFRYLGVIHQEYLRLRRAAELRCFKPGTNIHTYRTFAYLIGMTLVRSYQQAHRIHNAMLMRGFNGSFPVLEVPVVKKSDYILVVLLVSLGLLMAVIGR